jgi:hypothetical protein
MLAQVLGYLVPVPATVVGVRILSCWENVGNVGSLVATPAVVTRASNEKRKLKSNRQKANGSLVRKSSVLFFLSSPFLT